MIEPRSVLVVYFRSMKKRCYSVDVPISVKETIIGFIGIPTLSLDCPKEELILYNLIYHLLVDDGKLYNIGKGHRGWYLHQLLRTSAEAPDDVALDLGADCHVFCHDRLTSRLAFLAGEGDAVELRIYDLHHMSIIKTWKVSFIPMEPKEVGFNIEMALVGECVYVAFVRPNAYCELRFMRLDYHSETLKALPAWSYAFSLPTPKRARGRRAFLNRKDCWNRRKILELFPVRGQHSVDVCYQDDTSYRVTRVTRIITDDEFPSFRSCPILSRRWRDGLFENRVDGSNLMVFRNAGGSSHHICDYVLHRKGPDFDLAEERPLRDVLACDGSGSIYQLSSRRMSSRGLASRSDRLVIYHPFLHYISCLVSFHCPH